MEKEKVVFFLDYANINRVAREKRYRFDYHDLLCYVSEGRFLSDAYCYVPINPRNEHRLDRDVEELWSGGYIVNTKRGSIAGGTYRCNFEVEITMDILKIVQQIKPDIIVLASGNADFVSLLQDVRRSGVRVECAAFEETVGAELLLWHSIARTTDLLIVFPTEYPELPPVGFYLKEDIPLSVNGHLYQAAYHEACSDPLTQGWKWYCVYINAGSWQPAPVQRAGDWRKGDNLWTYFTLISEVLSGAED